MPKIEGVPMFDGPAPYLGPDPGRLAPLGPWVHEAACADLSEAARRPFTHDRAPAPEVGELLEATCQQCPVLDDCDRHATSAGELGWWGARWRTMADRTQARQQAA